MNFNKGLGLSSRFFSSLLIFFVVLTILPALSLAQGAKNDISPTTSRIEEGSCSAFYNTDSSLFFFASNMPQGAAPGQTLTISGSLENYGPLSIENASLYFLIREGNFTSTSSPVIAYEKLEDNVSLPINSRLPVSYDWTVPQNIEKKNYHVELFLVHGNKLFVPVNSAPIEFAAEGKSQTSPLTLVTTTFTTVQGRYVANLTFRNNTNADIRTPLGIGTYVGKGLTNKAINSVNDFVTIKKGVSITSVAIGGVNFSDKTILIQYQAAQGFNKFSIIPVKNSNVDEPGLIIGGLAENSEGLYAFGCLDELTYPKITKTKVVMSLTDKDGTVVSEQSKEYLGTSTPGVVAMKINDDELKKLAGYAKVSVSFFRGNTQVDKTSFVYECKQDGRGIMCGRQNNIDMGSFFVKYKNILIAILTIAIFLLLIGLIFMKKVKASIFMLVFILGAGLLIPNIADAQTWQSRMNTNVRSFGPGTTPRVIWGGMTSTWYKRYFQYAPYPSIENNNSGGYAMFEGWETSNNGGYDAGALSSDQSYNGTPYYAPVDFSHVALPMFYGVYIVTDGVTPVQNTNGQYSLGFYPASGGYNSWAVNVKPNSPNADVNTNWEIPVGTRIGFYLSTQQSTTGSGDQYFAWGSERLTGYGQYTWYNYGEYASSLPATLSSCKSDLYRDTATYDLSSTIDRWYTGGSTPPPTWNSGSYSCNYSSSGFQRKIAAKLIKPTISISGLDNFACEPLQSDGTMECEAVSVGTSTPIVTMSSTAGRVYGGSVFSLLRTGDVKAYNDGYIYYFPGGSVRVPETLQSNIYQADQGAMTIGDPVTAVPTYISEPTQSTKPYIQASNTVLPDGQAGFAVPAVSVTPFGNIQVVPVKTAPTAPVITEVGDPWAQSGTKFAFEAVSTDADANEGLMYEVDTNNNGVVDLTVGLASKYYTADSINTALDQPGYTYTGNGYYGYSKFSWDTYNAYEVSGGPIRFNATFSGGTSTIQVRAIDNTSRRSGWTQYDVYVPSPPSVPIDVNADPGSTCDSGIRISWGAQENRTAFNIYRWSWDLYDYELIGTTDGTETYFDDTEAAYPNSYSYQVAGVNDIGESDRVDVYGEPALPCDLLLPPDTFQSYTSSQCGGKIDLSWNEGAGAEGYYIERWSDDLGDYERIATLGSGELSYTDTPGYNVYPYYRIQSFKQNGDVSGYTDDWYGAQSSNSCDAPLPPVNIYGSTSSTCGGNVDFVWESSSGGPAFTEYRIYEFSYYGYPTQLVATVPSTETSYTHTQGNSDPSYYLISSYNGPTGEESNYGNVNEEGYPGNYYPGEVVPSNECVPTYQCSDDNDNNENGLRDYDGGSLGVEYADVEYCESAQDNLEGDPGCTRGSITRGDGESFKFYSTIIASTSVGCEAYAKNLTCNNGNWEDSLGNIDGGTTYKYSYCRLNADVRER